MYKYIKILFVMCLTITTTISAVSAREASPDWVGKLPAAKNAAQLFIVAGGGRDHGLGFLSREGCERSLDRAYDDSRVYRESRVG